MTEPRRQHLLTIMVRCGDEWFDPKSFLRTPQEWFPKGHRWENLGELREMLRYTLALLEIADQGRKGRAEAILHQVLLVLEHATNPKPGTRAAAAWGRQSIAALEDIALILVLIRVRHGRRLDDGLVVRIAQIVLRLARRDLGSRTALANAGLKGACTLLAIGAVNGSSEITERARVLLSVDGAESRGGNNAPAMDELCGELIVLYAVAYVVREPASARLVEKKIAAIWARLASIHAGKNRGEDGPATREARGNRTLPLLLQFMLERAEKFGAAPALQAGRNYDALLPCVLPIHLSAPSAAEVGRVFGHCDKPDNAAKHTRSASGRRSPARHES